MTEEIPKYPTVEKQMNASGVPFKVRKSEPRISWRSNYAYYLKQKREAGSVRPLFARKQNDGSFEVYEDGSWISRDLWKDYSEEQTDKDGNVINGPTGKPKKRLFFDEKFDFLIDFENPIPIEYWNSDQGQKVTEQHQIAWVRMSKNLSEKLKEQMKDPRVDTSRDFFVIDYDNTKTPAEQYKVRFHH